ncbi:alkylglycerol monooxygenase-like isoform X2 [Ptychodera flava]|uniref:alkylglycerol monooxygenase-like isoform X2 n=1 Tax=Ptychodera flava TaxID=63121 RepID=UPI003969E16D
MRIHSAEFSAYIWVCENLRLLDLAWNSPWTWIFCFLAVDVGYYWFHRFAHEVNFMWAFHQVHHSSEEYNLSTALRQSIFQRYTSWVFYVPIAFFVPPSIALVHIQFNTLYQFWIHTELIKTLGPLEYILNTPSHHRVHHGRNPYCIDKNYAGTLIIWDRMFGTFTPEDERIVYGVTHPLNSWNPIYIQFCHIIHMWNTFWSMSGIGHKLSVIFKGPGWEPGKPRLGCIEDIPKVKYPCPKYNSRYGVFGDVYILIHFLTIYLAFEDIARQVSGLSQIVVLCGMGYIVLTLTSIGAICDRKSYAPLLEFVRCALYLILDATWTNTCAPILRICQVINKAKVVRGLFTLSATIWLVNGIRNVNGKKTKSA